MTQTEYHVERPKNHWELDLEKTSLKEPALKSKYQWLKPLTVYHALEFRGLDKRDYYEPQDYDAWDHQAWNSQSVSKFNKKCADYYLDLKKCHHYLKSEYHILKKSFVNRTSYCWKMQDNYANCKRIYIRNNRRFVNDDAVFPEDH